MEQSNALLQVSEIQLVYKPVIKPSERLKISTSSDVYKMLLESWDIDKIELVEQFKIVLLNKANKVLGISTISSGGISGTVVDLKLIFAIALKGGATDVILAHNHPSGKLLPSAEDRAVTTKVAQAGKLLDLKVIDYLIITSEEYYSFAEEGLI